MKGPLSCHPIQVFLHFPGSDAPWRAGPFFVDVRLWFVASAQISFDVQMHISVFHFFLLVRYVDQLVLKWNSSNLKESVGVPGILHFFNAVLSLTTSSTLSKKMAGDFPGSEVQVGQHQFKRRDVPVWQHLTTGAFREVPWPCAATV